MEEKIKNFSKKISNGVDRKKKRDFLKAIEYLGEKYDKRGIFALDRGFDDRKYFKKFTELDLHFVIRMKKTEI